MQQPGPLSVICTKMTPRTELISPATGKKSEYEQEAPQSFKFLSLVCTKYTVIKDDIENGVDLRATVHTIS